MASKLDCLVQGFLKMVTTPKSLLNVTNDLKCSSVWTPLGTWNAAKLTEVIKYCWVEQNGYIGYEDTVFDMFIPTVNSVDFLWTFPSIDGSKSSV